MNRPWRSARVGASGFPGQSGDPVGFAATPSAQPSNWNAGSWPGAYPGSLTAWPGGTGSQTISDGTNATSGAGTAGNPWVFAFYDFNCSTTGTITVTVAHARFVGCRFQSNNGGPVVSSGVTILFNAGSSDLIFSYCSVVPLISKWTSPPNGAWPSAGAGQGIVPASAAYTNTGGYCIPANDAYQFAFAFNAPSGTITIDHCDIWGFGNAIGWATGVSTQSNVTDCWIHDAANCNVTASGQSTNFHTDGPGYLNGSTAPSNILIQHCTIATIGNTNAMAWQLVTSAYNNITMINNFLSGFGDNCSLSTLTTGNDTMTNTTFTDNVFGTDNPWIFGPLHNNYSTMFSGGGNLWKRNKLLVLAGTSPNGGSSPAWTNADDGKFLLPDSTLSTTDF